MTTSLSPKDDRIPMLFEIQVFFSLESTYPTVPLEVDIPRSESSKKLVETTLCPTSSLRSTFGGDTFGSRKGELADFVSRSPEPTWGELDTNNDVDDDIGCKKDLLETLCTFGGGDLWR